MPEPDEIKKEIDGADAHSQKVDDPVAGGDKKTAGENNDGGDTGHAQNGDDGKAVDHTQNDSDLTALETRLEEKLSKQLTGAIKRILGDKQKTEPQKGELDLSSEIEIDGERISINQLLQDRRKSREEAAKRESQEKEIALERALRARGVIKPEIIAKALRADGIQPDDHAYLDNFVKENPALVLDMTKNGAGTGGGSIAGMKKENFDITDPAQRESKLNQFAAGK